MKNLAFVCGKMFVNIHDDYEEEITVDGYIKYTVDRKYGADADGNRGISRVIVFDIKDFGAYNRLDERIILKKEDTARAEELLTRIFLEEGGK